MAIRRNYFNDPAFAAAASNLSALFAPPSGGDAAGWANATAKREEAARLAQLFEYAQAAETDLDRFDRMGAATGQWNPTQGFGARNMEDATKRYGIDVGAATSRANNAADNQRAMLGTLYQPLNQGQVRPALPGSLAEAYGMPGVDVPAVAGAPKPLSETEFNAAVLGTLPPAEQRAAALGNTPTATIVTPEGPRVAWQADSIGKEPFINKGAEAKPANAMGVLPDGRQVPAIQDVQTGRWKHAQTGEELPADVRIFDMAKPQGTAEEVGVSKPTNTAIEKQLIDIGVAKNTAVKLRDLIATSPASQGIVGWLRGSAQNVIQAGGEVGQFFGGGVADVQQRIENGLEDASLAGAFDPNIPAIEMMANLLAFQYAKTTTGERLSNEMLRNAKTALGLEGLTANQMSSISRLNQAIQLIEDQENMLRRVRTGGVDALAGPAPQGAPAAGMPSASPTTAAPAAPVERWQRGPDGRPVRVQ